MGKRYPASSYEIDEEYFLWLCELVDAEDPDAGYLGLMRRMYDMEFSDRTAKLIPNDDNRIEDGIELRERFEEESLFDDYSCLGGPCSVLEMMIALSYRMEENFGYEDHIYWFWDMMRNLGLDEFTDNRYFDLDGQSEVNHILRDFRMRKYGKDGCGGLFPRRNPERDQRRLEIWVQMNNYLIEKYMH